MEIALTADVAVAQGLIGGCLVKERAIKAVERIRSRERKLIDSVRGAGFKVSDLREGLLE